MLKENPGALNENDENDQQMIVNSLQDHSISPCRSEFQYESLQVFQDW